MVVIPGNHDSRNVGYVHFEELFGERNSVLNVGRATIVAVDSTEPDLDNGQIGRGRYGWIEEQFAGAADLRVFVLHHHLLPIPGTGRERNIVNDAGDALECLQRAEVDLVLAGPQARAVRVAARGSVRRQRGHGVVLAAARQGPALLQRRRGRGHARQRLAPVPVPRAGADHPVLDRDEDVREVHGADRGRGALDREGARADRRRALRAGRARCARRAAVRRSSPRCSSAAPRSCAAARTTACRWSRRSTLSRRISWSTSPTSRCSGRGSGCSGRRARSRSACRTSAPTSASTRRRCSRSSRRRSR